MSYAMDEFPNRPMDLDTVIEMDEAYEIAIDNHTDLVVALLNFEDDDVIGYGFSRDDREWVVLAESSVDTDEETVKRTFSAIEEWARIEYGDDAVIVSKGEREKNHRPWEVKQGLEPEYDCPECDFYGTGLSMGPHAFLDHLQEEHGMSREEAFDVLNG